MSENIHKKNRYPQEKIFGLNLSQEIKQVGNRFFFNIELAGKQVLLPLVDLVDVPYTIAWFDPSHERNPELAELASETMTNILTEIRPFAVFTPPSSKSEWFIRDALIKSQQRSGRSCAICQLVGGTDFMETQKKSLDGRVVTYQPVTGQTKYIGMPQFFNMDVIGKQCRDNGEQAVFVDDVYTTGTTIKAIKELTKINNAITAVIAREATLGLNYPPKLSHDMRAALFIPEIPTEKLDVSKLFSIKERQNIPQPIIK